MKAAGLSAHQILAPLLVTALGVSAASFAFNELVVARSTATLKAWQAADYGPVAPDTPDGPDAPEPHDPLPPSPDPEPD